MKVKESFKVTFDERSSPSKTSPLEDDDLVGGEGINIDKIDDFGNNTKSETLEIDEIINIMESKNHPSDNVIGILIQRSQAQDKSNFFCFISTIKPKNINEAIKDESVLVFPGYGVLVLFSSWSFVKCRHIYAVSSLMDTAYWLSEQKHHRASFKKKQNFSIRKCLHLLHMDRFRPVSPISINHEKYTLVIVDEYSRYTWVHFLRKKNQAPKMIMSFIRMVENKNDVKVKQIKTDNGVEFRNYELESFCDEKGISQHFSSPYTPKQNGEAERKNRTLIEAAKTMMNGSVLSKHFWTQNKSIIVKRHNKTPYEIFKERIPDISYFHVFGRHVFIHNYKDHLSKFDVKANDGYFLGYSFVSKTFRVFNIRRQQVEETYHVTFDASMEAIRFTSTLVDEIGIDDSSRYPPDEFIHKDNPSRQYQANSDILYYVIPYGHSLTELTQEKHVPEVIAPNEPDIPHTEDAEGPFDLINTEGTHEKMFRMNKLSPNPLKNRWSKYQHIELANIIGDPDEGMLTRNMAAKLTAASDSECLFVEFLSEIEPKKVSEALKHPRWVYAMQEELNQFHRNKVWTLVPLPYGKTAIGSKWVFKNKKYEHGITAKNKARLVAQGYSHEEGIDYDDTFAPPPVFESSEFPDYVCKLDKALYGLKQAPKACSLVKTPMVPPNNLAPDLVGKPILVQSKGITSNCYEKNPHVPERDHILKGDIELHFIPTEYQLADIFTKPLDEPTFTRLKAELGMLNID
ncbi:retrovirus-related pol polyprotein from transposon TNT 1-94 [Tanacetum coccineum]